MTDARSPRELCEAYAESVPQQVERLLEIWGNTERGQEQVRHHVYRNVHGDVRYHVGGDDPDHDAHRAALYAAGVATQIAGEPDHDGSGGQT